MMKCDRSCQDSLKSPNQIVIYARLHVPVTSIKFHLLHPEITGIVNVSFKLAIFVAMHREVTRECKTVG